MELMNFKSQIFNWHDPPRGFPDPHSAIELLFFLHSDCYPVTIEAAFRADAMRHARFPAVGTVAHRRRHKVVVCPALAGARF